MKTEALNRLISSQKKKNKAKEEKKALREE